jgi:hypothetical protein
MVRGWHWGWHGSYLGVLGFIVGDGSYIIFFTRRKKRRGITEHEEDGAFMAAMTFDFIVHHLATWEKICSSAFEIVVHDSVNNHPTSLHSGWLTFILHLIVFSNFI